MGSYVLVPPKNVSHRIDARLGILLHHHHKI